MRPAGRRHRSIAARPAVSSTAPQHGAAAANAGSGTLTVTQEAERRLVKIISVKQKLLKNQYSNSVCASLLSNPSRC